MNQVLIISPELWDGQFASKHHYAITLAEKGHKVYFLNPPNNALKQIEIEATNYKNLWSVSAPQAAKGLRFYPEVLRNFIEKRWLEKLEKIIGLEFTIIWLFENSRFYDMGFAGDRLKIYHQVDSNQNFHTKEAASSADICFCVTDFIKRDLLLYNRKVFKIPHGINFPTEKIALSKKQKNRFNKDAINVAYIGNLDIIYIDEIILYNLIQAHSNITFHFIGSYSENGSLYKICKEMKNIIWWGRVESILIPSILEKIDINLLVYKVEEYPEQLANSHKILEYLYSGKVTVATYTDEYKDKRNLLEMVDNSNEFESAFENVVNNLDNYNSEEKQAERIAFAKNNSYEKQLEKILKYLIQYNFAL